MTIMVEKQARREPRTFQRHRKRAQQAHNVGNRRSVPVKEQTIYQGYNPFSSFGSEVYNLMTGASTQGITFASGSSPGRSGPTSTSRSRSSATSRSSHPTSTTSRSSSSARPSSTQRSSSSRSRTSSSSSSRSSSRSSSSKAGSSPSSSSSSSSSSKSSSSSSYPSTSSVNDFGSASTVQTLGSSSATSATSSSSASLTNQNAMSHGVGGSGLSSGAVAGIAIGGAAGLALLGLIAWLIARWASKQNEAEERPMMHQGTEPPVSSEYQMPPNDSNMSFAPSYDAYAQPMQPATYEGQYAGNGYSYRDPVAEAAAGIQHPPQAAQYASNMTFVPGQPVNAMGQAEAITTDETQPTQRHRENKKRRDNRVNEWVDADVNPVSDYGADPYRTAGVGSHWTSPEDFDAQVQRTSSGGQNSWPSSNDLASEKHTGDEQLSELDTPSRHRKKRYTNSHGVPREHYADRSQGTYDNSDQYDNDWNYSGMGEENSLSELPYTRRRQQRNRTTRDLTPSHDIDLDAEQAVENLRASRRPTYSHRSYF